LFRKLVTKKEYKRLVTTAFYSYSFEMNPHWRKNIEPS